MKEILFNPLIVPNPNGLGPVLPNKQLGIPSWATHVDGWWAGATIGYPDIDGALEANRTLKRVVQLREQIKAGKNNAAEKMHELYVTTTQECRNNLLSALQTSPHEATVILETSGTSAISLVRHLLPLNSDAVVVTTTEEGNLVKPALMGRDPWNYPKSAFYENVQLFTHHRETQVIPSDKEANKVSAIDVMCDGKWKSNNAILQEIKTLLATNTIACMLIPLATKTGRLLPVREIGYLIKEHTAQTKKPVTYIVDAIQALGRTDAEAIANPLEYCDAFICSSSKALGGILISSAIVAKPELVQQGLPHLLNSSYSHHLRFYQFDSTWSQYIDPILTARNEHQAISLPEIASFNRVLKNYLNRGQGNTHSEQRKSQLEIVKNKRLEILAALELIPQVLVLNQGDGTPLVSSIITLKTQTDISLPARKLKELLQDPLLGDVVTPSAPVGNLLRLEIPEYRRVPKIDTLFNKLRLVLEGK